MSSVSSTPAVQIKEIVSVNFATEPSNKVSQGLVTEPANQQETAKDGGALVESETSRIATEAGLVNGSDVIVGSPTDNVPDVVELLGENIPDIVPADENVSEMAVAESANKNVINNELDTETVGLIDVVNDNITNVESTNKTITGGAV